MSAAARCAAGYAAADWLALAAHRGQAGGEEPAGWAAAIDHLAGGCAGCRRAAVAADPTLLFHRLASPLPAAGSSNTPADPEVAAMQQAVAALRTASRVGGQAGHAGGRLSAIRARGWHGAGRLAAAAGLAAAALLAVPRSPGAPALARLATLPEAGPALAVAVRPVLTAVPAALRGPQQMPLLEDLNRPDARIYQIDGGNLAVVMIVDEKLDV